MLPMPAPSFTDAASSGVTASVNYSGMRVGGFGGETNPSKIPDFLSSRMAGSAVTSLPATSSLLMLAAAGGLLLILIMRRK